MTGATRDIAIISTGGTIEKTYCQHDGSLRNEGSVLDLLLASLDTSAVRIRRVALLDKDSLDMTEDDHDLIARTVVDLAPTTDGIIIVHGTDRLAVTGERVHEAMIASGRMSLPVVLTGAMRPFELRTSDATQNITEALIAVRILDPGVFCVMHGRVLPFPGVVKDRERGTFIPSGE
ncbi:MAG: asparaginase [Phycisphaerales bacterium]|nr:asparaginase [Phycisphaerales bacterium]